MSAEGNDSVAGRLRAGGDSSRCGTASGDDVGHAAIAQPLDFVLQAKLALLEPRELQLVGRPLGYQRCDLLVERTMLCLERRQLLGRRPVVIHGGSLVDSPPDGKTRQGPPASQAAR